LIAAEPIGSQPPNATTILVQQAVQMTLFKSAHPAITKIARPEATHMRKLKAQLACLNPGQSAAAPSNPDTSVLIGDTPVDLRNAHLASVAVISRTVTTI